VSDLALSPAISARIPPAAERRRERRQTCLLLAIAALGRIPFWWHGFGGHPDEWLVIRSGLDVWRHAIYYPSRIPGYPFDEVLMGGLAWLGGAAACAAAATLASLVTLAYLRALAPLYGIRDWFWMALAFSFEPWVWSSGTHGLDYIWGTGALVAALYHLERRQLALSGLACAIGYGFRPSSLLWIVPVFVRLLLIERRWREILRFCLWAAIPALIPTAPLIWALVTRPDAWSGAGTYNLHLIEHSYIPLSLLAGYHLIELLSIPGALVIIAAGVKYRRQLFSLFRSGEGWVWCFVLIFLLQVPTFIMESGKTEYMLPALPGLFLVLGRSLSNNWWKVLTAAFVFSAFVSFGFGHAPHAPQAGGVRVALAAPSLRPGALLWYADRAKDSNDAVRRAGAALMQPGAIVRAGPDLDRLDDFYVSAVLKRGPASQARISCPLIPARLSFAPDQSPRITPSVGLPKPPPGFYPMLVCCPAASGLVLLNTPSPAKKDGLAEAIGGFCQSRAQPAAANSRDP
jgi:hypothetical protein